MTVQYNMRLSIANVRSKTEIYTQTSSFICGTYHETISKHSLGVQLAKNSKIFQQCVISLNFAENDNNNKKYKNMRGKNALKMEQLVQ